jgi:hypothetical protein
MTQTHRAIMSRVVRQSSAIAIGAALILGAATFVAVPLLAQNGEPAKPAEAGKADPGKTEPGKIEPGKGELGKTESAKDAAGRLPDESVESVRVLMGAAGRGECVWLGERAVGLMWKDDLDTAFRHLELYDRFGCPGEHVQVSFRCVVRQGPIDQKDQKATDAFNARVHSCWMNPALPAAPANPPTAAVEKPGAK